MRAYIGSCPFYLTNLKLLKEKFTFCMRQKELTENKKDIKIQSKRLKIIIFKITINY